MKEHNNLPKDLAIPNTIKLPELKKVEALPRVVGYQPLGKTVLFSIITHEEIIGSQIVITTKDSDVVPQARIEAIGPLVEEKYGLAVGQRCIISGTYCKLADLGDDRRRGLCDPEAIKGVCLEEK